MTNVSVFSGKLLGLGQDSGITTFMSVELRPHHLLCLLTYLGKGYTPAFVENYERVVTRLNAGETITIVSGPDEICHPMLNDPSCHCRNESVAIRDQQALAAVLTCLRLEAITEPFVLAQDDVLRLRRAFQNGDLRAACQGCEWELLCSRIAKNDFRGCRLQPPPKE
ncbi:conserved hypothetical protein [Roseibium sp. TrichSKD4]|nr:conserved hypothetical protein [Roseibium sp. TrichSKD4]